MENLTLDNLNEEPLQKACWQCRAIPDTSSRPRELRIELTGDFNALQTIDRMIDSLHPSNYYERIVLDFTRVRRVKPIELFHLFAELETNPRFNFVEICIEGIQFSYEIGREKKGESAIGGKL